MTAAVPDQAAAPLLSVRDLHVTYGTAASAVPAVRGVDLDLDVGETLVDEARGWEAIADELGVPHFTFCGVIGGLAARGDQVALLGGGQRRVPGVEPDGELDDEQAGEDQGGGQDRELDRTRAAIAPAACQARAYRREPASHPAPFHYRLR